MKYIYFIMIFALLLAGCPGAKSSQETEGGGAASSQITFGSKGLIEQITDLAIVVSIIIGAAYVLIQLKKGKWGWFGG